MTGEKKQALYPSFALHILIISPPLTRSNLVEEVLLRLSEVQPFAGGYLTSSPELGFLRPRATD